MKSDFKREVLVPAETGVMQIAPKPGLCSLQFSERAGEGALVEESDIRSAIGSQQVTGLPGCPMGPCLGKMGFLWQSRA